MLKNVGGKNGNNKIWKKLILLFIKDALNWFKVTVKFYVATKKIYLKSMLFFIWKIILKHLLWFEAAHLFSALIIRDGSWAPNQHI